MLDYEVDNEAMAEADNNSYLAHLEDEAIAQEAAEADAEYEALSYYQNEIDDEDEGG